VQYRTPSRLRVMSVQCCSGAAGSGCEDSGRVYSRYFSKARRSAAKVRPDLYNQVGPPSGSVRSAWLAVSRALSPCKRPWAHDTHTCEARSGGPALGSTGSACAHRITEPLTGGPTWKRPCSCHPPPWNVRDPCGWLRRSTPRRVRLRSVRTPPADWKPLVDQRATRSTHV